MLFPLSVLVPLSILALPLLPRLAGESIRGIRGVTLAVDMLCFPFLVALDTDGRASSSVRPGLEDLSFGLFPRPVVGLGIGDFVPTPGEGWISSAVP